MAIDILSWAPTKLESDIDKPERWLSSGRMLCEWLSRPNEELNAFLPSTQNHHWKQFNPTNCRGYPGGNFVTLHYITIQIVCYVCYDDCKWFSPVAQNWGLFLYPERIFQRRGSELLILFCISRSLYLAFLIRQNWRYGKFFLPTNWFLRTMELRLGFVKVFEMISKFSKYLLALRLHHFSHLQSWLEHLSGHSATILSTFPQILSVWVKRGTHL